MRDEKKYRPIRQQARKLIVEEGLAQNEVATSLNVARKTIGIWYSKYNWKKEREDFLKPSGRANSLYDFIAFTREKHPNEFQAIEPLYKAYINAI